jgi:hypothetical protein
MNHRAETEGINSMQVKGESAILVCNPAAVLSNMRIDLGLNEYPGSKLR